MNDHLNAAGEEPGRLLRPHTWDHAGARAPASASSVAPVHSQRAAQLWNAASGQFSGAQLRAAIVARGWTVREFYGAARVSKGCLYKALAGRAVSDRTVLRIVALLETRPPSGLIDG